MAMTIDQPKKEKLVGDNIEETQDFFCLSTDARPERAPNGSRLFELNESEATLTLLLFFSGVGWKAIAVFDLVSQGG